MARSTLLVEFVLFALDYIENQHIGTTEHDDECISAVDSWKTPVL